MKDDGYKITNQYAVHFITFAVVEWVNVFTRKVYADTLLESLRYCISNKGLKVHAWCIMSNHVHLIESATDRILIKKLNFDLICTECCKLSIKILWRKPDAVKMNPLKNEFKT